jgi:hypothetical protein
MLCFIFIDLSSFFRLIKRSLSNNNHFNMNLFFKANFCIQFFILIFNMFVLIPDLFLLFSPIAAKVALSFHLVHGNGILPLKVFLLFEAGKGEFAFALGTNGIVCRNPLLNVFLFEVGLTAVSEGRFFGDAISEGTRVLLPLRLKELKSRNLPTVLFKVIPFSLWIVCCLEKSKKPIFSCPH